MIQLVGLIVAVYAVARLIQVPLEALPSSVRWVWLLLVSGPAILAIAILTFLLLNAGTNIEMPKVPQ